MNLRYQGFGAISKVEDQEDGTIKVYGIASTGERDAADEIVLPEAMEKALPDYSKFPALREMHQPSAAGSVLEASVDADGITNIIAHVVDPVAITKVKTNVYRGFSIGGKVLERDNADRSIIKALRLTEISLVDVPCNPGATLNMWKADMNRNPTAEETVAKAKELAESDGRKNYKDYLFKAREALLAEAAEAEGGDTTPETPITSEIPPVDGEGEGNAPIDAENAPTGENEGEQVELSAPSDPITALAAAIDTAKAAVIVEAPATPSAYDAVRALPDLGALGKALVVIGERGQNDLLKGMYSCSRLASIIEDASYLQSSVTWESECEGDGSTVPAQLAQAIANLGATLIAMVQEEVAEIIAEFAESGMDIDFDPSAGGDAGDLELAAQTVDLVKADTVLMEKVGARNSKADAEKVQGIHDHAAALGAACATGDAEKAATLAAENERLSKALSDAAPQIEELTKAFSASLDSMRAEVQTLTKRLEQVENEPAAPKTASVLTPITKGQDASGVTEEASPLVTADDFRKALDTLPEEERGLLLLKVALANPTVVPGARAAR